MIRSGSTACYVHKEDRGVPPGSTYMNRLARWQEVRPGSRVVAAVSHGDFIHTVWEWEEE